MVRREQREREAGKVVKRKLRLSEGQQQLEMAEEVEVRIWVQSKETRLNDSILCLTWVGVKRAVKLKMTRWKSIVAYAERQQRIEEGP